MRIVSFKLFIFLLTIILIGIVISGAAALQGESDEEFCQMYPESCQGNGGSNGDGDDSGPPWDGYTDGRISPDPAEYYTIYCHEGTDTIYVIRVVPETETIKEIPLIDAISLDIGNEQPLGDFMVMKRSGEDTITIYGSNGNGAPEPGSKAFSLSECIATNGGAPEPGDAPPPAGDAGDMPDEESSEKPTRREAEESLEFCFSSYEFFGGDSSLLANCLDYTLATYRPVLTGTEIVSLIVMVFCLNIAVGNGILPIGIILFLGLHRRWLRRWNVSGRE